VYVVVLRIVEYENTQRRVVKPCSRQDRARLIHRRLLKERWVTRSIGSLPLFLEIDVETVR
jgi:hypothetical protein